MKNIYLNSNNELDFTPSNEKDNYIIKNYHNKNGKPIGIKLVYAEKLRPNDFNYLSLRYNDSYSLKETLFRIKNHIEKHPLCPTCGKPIKFVGVFKKHCSRKCSANDPTTRDKCSKTCIEKYGVTNVFQDKEVINKIKETCIEKYGVNSYVKTNEYQNKKKKTCLEKYGVDDHMRSAAVKSKIKNTFISKYGVTNPGAIPEVKNKVRQTSLKRYGTKCTFQAPHVLEQIKKTNLEKYGYENPSSSIIIRKKVENTMLKKYGVKCGLSSKYIREKGKQTSLIKYGYEFPSQSKQVKQKILDAKHKNHSFGKSKEEDYIYEQLIKKYPNTKRQYFSERYKHSCDFYIPDLDMFIEYQGFWTHHDHPYDPLNENDQLRANSLKTHGTTFYTIAYEIWTKSDPAKRREAKDNKLNFIEIWNLNQFKEFYKTI